MIYENFDDLLEDCHSASQQRQINLEAVYNPSALKLHVEATDDGMDYQGHIAYLCSVRDLW